MSRTFETTVYKFEELSPEAQEHAIEKWREATWRNGDYAWLNEIHDSFKEIWRYINGVKLHLRNYELDYDNPSSSWCKSDFMEDNAADLIGQRAIAWFENNFFCNLRESRPFIRRTKEYSGKKYSFNRYGQIPDCPFTGVCFDEDFIDHIRKNMGKETVKETLQGLAFVAGKLGEAEIESQNSDEYIRETIIANEYEFTEDGEMI